MYRTIIIYAVFFRITHSDLSDYTCVARNGEGRIHHTVRVVIAGENMRNTSVVMSQEFYSAYTKSVFNFYSATFKLLAELVTTPVRFSQNYQTE